METLNEQVQEYRRQMELGTIRQAYQGLMGFMLNLKTTFKSKYPHYFVSGDIYHGFMDMTYFSCMPESLKQRKLRIGLVLIHETVKFEVWLSGFNNTVQKKYWQIFSENGWKKYPIVTTPQGALYITSHLLDEYPDFRDLDVLAGRIEASALRFISEIEEFLTTYD